MTTTRDRSLDDVLARLAQHPAVQGLLTIGSTDTARWHAASDYDIVIVLRETARPFHVGVAAIDGRLSDLIFVPSAEVAAVSALDAPLDPDSGTGRVARWLRAGQIRFDRDGDLGRAQRQVAAGEWLLPPADAAARDAAFGINYNLAQTRRLLASSDPLYAQTAGLRMALYAPGDLVFGFFAARRLLWEGDKAAVRHLAAHAPEYWALLGQFLAEPDLARKLALYERLAAGATAPAGGLWASDATITQRDDGAALWAEVFGALV
jgi:hypothetical protein